MGTNAAGKAPASAARDENQASPGKKKSGDASKNHLPMVGAAIGAIVGFIVMFAVVTFLLSSNSQDDDVAKNEPIASESKSGVSASAAQAASQAVGDYREVNLPIDTRKRIYDDYRKVARTTVEKPLLGKPGSAMRMPLENMLDATFERELLRFAALHDVSVDDIKEIIKEGDAKVWDDSPRSNATRGGKRVYPKEES